MRRSITPVETIMVCWPDSVNRASRSLLGRKVHAAWKARVEYAPQKPIPKSRQHRYSPEFRALAEFL